MSSLTTDLIDCPILVVNI